MEPDDAEQTLIRPYTITRGRTVPERDDLTLITMVATVDDDELPAAGRLEPEHRAILDRCRTPAALAEIAATLDLPVSVTKILIDDLISLGRVKVRAPRPADQGGLNTTLLQAVRDGLQRL
ncbi:MULTISPECIES: DUF742 domain-containing protein [Streptomyces]|uniref:DUF742 domain-containing protein n=2 Tax=Streptomyces lycii TaxID=2654337 RepID=A0ABQ7FQE9_9ACTN|nr:MULTISPECIES: DUF742 domain-containing protein [Streptomyces]KAF4411147.1 DUF742 domain-containing protein [Streptomyces lycii]PGH52522.1 hypothetical protein CRI70_01020 [Streptomyces sp. Ru87]